MRKSLDTTDYPAGALSVLAPELTNQLGYCIFLVTNQAGIARGYESERDFFELTNWMCGVFKGRGVVIDKVYHCPSHP